MQLIGMLDSPYVRRVAISLQLLGLPFEHRSVSVFRGFEAFSAINPVVKAPTLVCDDGTVLMDSTLILEYAQALAAPGRSLMPTNLPGDLPALRQALHAIGLALAVCDKSVQIVYEQQLRPADKQHAPWLARVEGQLQSALGGLEAVVAVRPDAALDQALLTAAVGWHFCRQMMPERAPEARYPALAALSARAEATPAFRAAAHGDGVYPLPI